MSRALTVEDATVLKTTLVALLMHYSSVDDSELNLIDTWIPTPNGCEDEVMDAIDRVRIDGKAVVRTERTIKNGKPFYNLNYGSTETDFPGGPETVCLALTIRIHKLIGMPAPDTERDEPAEDQATIDRLTASIEIVEPVETVD